MNKKSFDKIMNDKMALYNKEVNKQNNELKSLLNSDITDLDLVNNFQDWLGAYSYIKNNAKLLYEFKESVFNSKTYFYDLNNEILRIEFSEIDNKPVFYKVMQNKDIIERELKKLGLKIGCYDKRINEINNKYLKILLDNLEWSFDTDIILNRKKYVVELDVIDNEMDLNLLTKAEYIDRYGSDRWDD